MDLLNSRGHLMIVAEKDNEIKNLKMLLEGETARCKAQAERIQELERVLLKELDKTLKG